MANKGRFIDRSPRISAAGKASGSDEEIMASAMKENYLEDTVTVMKHDSNISKEVFVQPRDLSPIQNPSQIKDVSNPHLKTRYQNMIEYLKETTYGSSWKKELGKAEDNETKEPMVKEHLNHPNTPYEVLLDGQVTHDLYRKNHNDYNQSERINRGYNDSFCPDKIFGGKSPHDPRGIWVRCTCKWHVNEHTDLSSRIQANFNERTKPQLGKVLAPNHNIDSVAKGHSFGATKASHFHHGVPDLVKDEDKEPCLFKRDFYKWLGSLNAFTLMMKKRSNDDFNFDDFYRRSLYFDKEKTGWLPIDLFYQVCADHKMTFPKEDMESLMTVLGVIADDRIDYHRFMNIINTNTPPLQIMEFTDIPKESKYYLMPNQAASCDYIILDNSTMTAAGVPSVRFDMERPIKSFRASLADEDNLKDNTSVDALINPSIYTNYGLTYRDFFLPRSPEMLRSLFEEVGYNFPGDSFDKLWKTGFETDKTGLVCIDTFKKLLKNYSPPPKLFVDEQESNENY